MRYNLQVKLLEEEPDLERLYLKVVKLLSEVHKPRKFCTSEATNKLSGHKRAKKPGKHPKLANDLVF